MQYELYFCVSHMQLRRSQNLFIAGSPPAKFIDVGSDLLGIFQIVDTASLGRNRARPRPVIGLACKRIGQSALYWVPA